MAGSCRRVRPRSPMPHTRSYFFLVLSLSFFGFLVSFFRALFPLAIAGSPELWNKCRVHGNAIRLFRAADECTRSAVLVQGRRIGRSEDTLPPTEVGRAGGASEALPRKSPIRRCLSRTGRFFSCGAFLAIPAA